MAAVDRVANPYVPGAGRTPAALVGRDGEISLWSGSLRRVESGRTAQPVVLYGLRGVGKTVLLSHFRRAAEEHGWVVAQVEAGSGKPLRSAVGDALHGPIVDFVKPTPRRSLLKALKTALSFKASYDSGGTWNFGLDLSGEPGGGADSGDLETDFAKLFADLCAAARDDGVGVAVLIDEAQDLTGDELSAICALAHLAGQREWAFQLALAGLPSLPSDLAEAKSYAERLFDYRVIEALSDALAEDALALPAQEEGVDWQAEALTHAVSEARGYPYFLQQVGQDSWNAATGTQIGLADARVGTATAWQSLDAGFFRARWDRATKAEQQYLRAMAADGDAGSWTRDVCQRLDKRSSSLGPARAKLISKGLIYAPEHGRVAFTVPGMAAFIARQSSD